LAISGSSLKPSATSKRIKLNHMAKIDQRQFC
jgi:hypothetical protein